MKTERYLRYHQTTVHQKINIRSYLSTYDKLSRLGKEIRLPYYRAWRPYKNLNYISFLGDMNIENLPEHNGSSLEHFENKF